MERCINGQTVEGDEDDWFDDDDDIIDDAVRKGLIDRTFLKFFTEHNSDQEDDK